jgi:hypothetical protein
MKDTAKKSTTKKEKVTAKKVTAEKAVAKKTTAKKATTRKESSVKFTWVVIGDHSDPGSNHCYKFFVSEEEYDKVEELIYENTDDEMYFGDSGMGWEATCPIMTLEDAKREFNELLGNDPIPESYDKEWADMMNTRQKEILKKRKVQYDYGTWDTFAEEHPKAAAKAISKGAFVLNLDNQLTEHYYVFRTDEERQSFRQYVIDILKIPEEDQDPCRFYHEEGDDGVYLFDELEKDILAKNPDAWMSSHYYKH